MQDNKAANKQDEKPKSLQDKIKDCRELIIQNMEKTLQHKMVYMFLKDRKKDSDVKQFSVNSKDGIIKIEFNDHEKAQQFYKDANFNEKILLRPFNIYFNLQLTEGEMKKYYLEGITEENQRKLFEIANEISICKIYTSYGSGTRAKLKSTGLLSFIRKDPIPEEQFKGLEGKLNQINIKISTYIHDKGTKVSLNLVDIISDDRFNEEEKTIEDSAEKEAKEIVEKYAKGVNPQHLSVIARKKEAVVKDFNKGTETKVNKVKTSALFEFDTAELTYEVYEKVRIGIKDDKQVKVRLFFHNEENNSYLSLITQGLQKPEGKTEKQFEEDLIEGFRTVNKNVIQVNIYPMNIPGLKDIYIGRTYLKNEEEGKNFLVDYPKFRSHLFQFYNKSGNISFNITIDSKTLRKIRNAEKKARQTEDKIKKTSEAQRRDNRRGPASNPINLAAGPFNGPMGLMGPTGPMMGPPPPGMMGGMPPMGDNMMRIPPGPVPFKQGGMPMGQPGMGMMPPNTKVDSKVKIANSLRDKQRLLDMEPNIAKRILVEPLKIIAEEEGADQNMRLINLLISNKTVEELYRYLDKTESIKAAIERIKQSEN